MDKQNLSISIAIPAYNEEENIEAVVKDTLINLPKYFKTYEVIVIDDGSTDSTGEILDRLAKKNKRLKIIHQKNGGYNKAMQTGLSAAKNDYVAYMQADGQNKISDLKKCFQIMDHYDLVLGDRGNRLDYSPYRLILSHGFLIMLWTLFGIKYHDVNWLYIWKTKEIQKLKLDPNGGVFILVESLVKFRRAGLKIGEAPAPYRSRQGGQAKNMRFKVVRNTFISAMKLKWALMQGKA